MHLRTIQNKNLSGHGVFLFNRYEEEKKDLFIVKDWYETETILFARSAYTFFTSPGEHPEDVKKIVGFQQLVKISPVHPDWVTKGAHVHIYEYEFSIRPADNGRIVIMPTFNKKINLRIFNFMSEIISVLISNNNFRNKLIHFIRGAIERYGKDDNDMSKSAGCEFYFLLKALLKY